MNFLEICGSLSLAYVVYVTLKPFVGFLYRRLARICNESPLKPQAGDYAIITGSTNGIGLEYARQLAQKGYNLLLLSRDEIKLGKVSDDIRKEYPQCQNADILEVDFSREDIYEKIRDKVAKLNGNVAILVNNVGISYHIPEYFASIPESFNKKLIMTNVLSTTMMSQIVLQKMINQKRGIIINISSFVGNSEFPLFALYSASKAFINSLGSCLNTEYREHGIIVQTVIPNQVKTKLSEQVYEKSISVTAKDFVEQALKTVGSERLTSGHIKHKLVNNLALLVEQMMGYDYFMSFKFLTTKKSRNDYLSKQ